MNVVDIGNTCFSEPSIVAFGLGSGLAFPGSGAIIGDSCDLLQANNYCNLNVVGNALTTSGQLRVQVQCSDTDVSGSFTDPTSGLAAFPGAFESGGILRLNSGGVGGGLFGAFVSGQAIQSGFNVFQGFQRPQRYARANTVSGDRYVGPLSVSFVSQLKTAGSGGGYTTSPTSGSVNV